MVSMPGVMACHQVDVEDSVGGWDIIKAMLGYVWPKGDLRIKSRVVVALSLLVVAKVRILGGILESGLTAVHGLHL